ncbi:hypothetical protein GCM10009609_75970 [Pseudonocardia aurantiaca]|uniref:Uncharacterized protein n=1 Tax=Pseudonocardia aurantiaca TaxID=75290 RepID=A0ABW4FVL9_9PSEU
MRILGDVNLATAATSATIATIASFIVARAVSVRQARAKTREDARHTIMRIIAPLLGHVRLTIDASRGQQPWRPFPRVRKLSEDGLPGDIELLGELARAADDLGPARRWITRRAAARAFGRELYDLARLARWSTREEVNGAAFRVLIVGVPQRPHRPGLWELCTTDPTPRRLRMLDGTLARLHASGALLGPGPVVVPRWCRPVDRLTAAVRLPERGPQPRPAESTGADEALNLRQTTDESQAESAKPLTTD